MWQWKLVSLYCLALSHTSGNMSCCICSASNFWQTHPSELSLNAHCSRGISACQTIQQAIRCTQKLHWESINCHCKTFLFFFVFTCITTTLRFSPWHVTRFLSQSQDTESSKDRTSMKGEQDLDAISSRARMLKLLQLLSYRQTSSCSIAK